MDRQRRIYYSKKAWGFLLQLLYPLRCPVCDRIVVPAGEKVCLVYASYFYFFFISFLFLPCLLSASPLEYKI